jgi:hypothetical protein
VASRALPALFPNNMPATLAGQAYAKAALLIGLAYGAIVAVLLFFASQLYAGGLLHLRVPRDLTIVLLFGVIIACQSYSSVVHVVFEEIAHLSSWTASAVGTAVALGAAASFAVDSQSAINVYALAAGPSLIPVLFWNVPRFIRAIVQRVSVLGSGEDLERHRECRGGVVGGGHRTGPLRWSCETST